MSLLNQSIVDQLRKLADMIEAESQSTESVPEPAEECYDEPNEDHFEDHVDEPNDPDTTMVPPLQQNIELLKKIAGVESIYDNEDSICNCEGECTCGYVPPEDELDILKRNAGLAVVASTSFPES